jgi:cyclic pyranopterin phosphate synthase
MPEHFNDFLSKSALLSYEELLRLMQILSALGVRKLRLTGGEPFVRRDLMQFIEQLAQEQLFEQIHITTNGVLTAPLIPRLKAAGIRGVNLSLDTLNRERFFQITRRDQLPEVLHTLDLLMEHAIQTRINMVVMSNVNTDDILSMAELTRDLPIEIRFIEEMPFNGSGSTPTLTWDYQRILHQLSTSYDLTPLDFENNGTAMRYSINKHQGKVGIIAAYSRTFCGTCNRLRISPKGELQTCLYGRSTHSVFDLLRNRASDEAIQEAILNAVRAKPKDGFAAEREMIAHDHLHRSMNTIGG